MTAAVKELYEATMELAKRLGAAEYQEFIALVELREKALHELQQRQAELHEHEKLKLREIGELDTVIVARMNALKEEASQGRRRIAQTRQQKKMYQAVYTPDSIFFDKRK